MKSRSGIDRIRGGKGAKTSTNKPKLSKEYLDNVKKVLKMDDGTKFTITYSPENKMMFEVGRGSYRNTPNTLGIKFLGSKDIIFPANNKSAIRKFLVNTTDFGFPKELKVTTQKERDEALRARQAEIQRQAEERFRQIFNGL